MTGLRPAARLARREVLRRPGRTALVVALVALPVAAMTLAVVWARTEPPSALVQWEQSAGQADAVRHPGPDPNAVPTTAGLPPGTRAVPVQDGFGFFRTVDGERSELHVSDAPLDDPIVDGMVELVEGRAPQRDGEAAVTAGLADAFDVGIGDTVAFERPHVVRWLVVGLVEHPSCLSCARAVLAPGTDLPVPDASTATRLLLDVPEGVSRTALTRIPSEESISVRWGGGGLSHQDQNVRWVLVFGVVALTVAGIVIAAAFAVGARRQLVTIGQLAATGAGPGVVRAALVLQGTWCGLMGTAVGLAGAALLLGGGRDWFERAVDHRIGPWVVRPSEMVVVAGFGVVAATVAALLPARTAAGTPTLDALAGRRPLGPVPRRLTIGGLVAVATGLGLLALAVVGGRSGQDGSVWTLVAIAGGVTELLGACAVAPQVISLLEPLAARVRGARRLAARGVARQRTRSGGVVSAVSAAGALAICASALVLGADARNPDDLQVRDDVVVVTTSEYGTPESGLPEPAPELAAALDQITGGADPVVIRTADTPSGYWDVEPVEPGEVPGSEGLVSGFHLPAVADPAVLDRFGVPDEAREALDRDGVVALSGEGDGDVVVVTPRGERLPTQVVEADHAVGDFSLLIRPEVAARLGHDAEETTLAWFSPDPLTDEERDELWAVVTELQSAAHPPAYSVRWEHPAEGPTPLQIELLLSGLALVFSLFVVGTGLALAAAEAKDERDVLTVAGAPPATLARMAGAKAWLLAVVGGLLAVPVGFLPVVVFTQVSKGDGSPYPLVLPVRTIALLVVAVPLVAALVATLASRTAQALRPVRVSTVAFE